MKRMWTVNSSGERTTAAKGTRSMIPFVLLLCAAAATAAIVYLKSSVPPVEPAPERSASAPAILDTQDNGFEEDVRHLLQNADRASQDAFKLYRMDLDRIINKWKPKLCFSSGDSE